MINNHSILLIDPSFDPETANQCSLLVKVGLDSLSYAIIANKNQHVLAVFNEQECEDGPQSFASRLKTDPYLGLDYNEVKVAAYTPNSISIPNDLYDEETVSASTQYFAAHHSENVYSYKEPKFDFTTIFSFSEATDKTVNSIANKKYTENAGLMSLCKNLTADSLLIDFTVNSFSVLYFASNQIVFQQCYQIDNANEFNYYLLLMKQQLKIEDETEILLTGVVQEDDDNYKCLSKYFSNIQFMTFIQNLDQEVLSDMPAHYFTSLLALKECV